MPNRFTIREEPGRSWSVVQRDTGMPITLAGIPQTGLDLEDAEQLIERLDPDTNQAEPHPAVQH